MCACVPRGASRLPPVMGRPSGSVDRVAVSHCFTTLQQVWMTRHPCDAGRAWWRRNCRVHAGFLKAWLADGFSTAVLACVRKLAAHIDPSSLRILTTGLHCPVQWLHPPQTQVPRRCCAIRIYLVVGCEDTLLDELDMRNVRSYLRCHCCVIPSAAAFRPLDIGTHGNVCFDRPLAGRQPGIACSLRHCQAAAAGE